MRRFACLTLSAFAAALTTAAPAPLPRADSAADLKALEGAWEVVHIERGGKDQSGLVAGGRVAFSAGRFEQTGEGIVVRSHVEVDARTKPRRLRLGGKAPARRTSASGLPDVIDQPAALVLLRVAGIYGLEGDRLRLSFFVDGCDTGERPAAFELTSERHVTITFKRVKGIP